MVGRCRGQILPFHNYYQSDGRVKGLVGFQSPQREPKRVIGNS